MITTLHIKNIGIIDDLSIDLNQGLNVLTGETGAGKTLIIDSIGIISGGRFSKEMIRKGENTSYIEICMYEPNSKEAIDGNIIVSRQIWANGRNMCKINGRMVTVNELKDFMKRYIEIHGQNDNQTLLESKTHLMYLDSFIGDKIIEIKSKYYEKYQRFNEINIELKANYGDEKERERKLDLLRYQISEIEEANLTENEEEILKLISQNLKEKWDISRISKVNTALLKLATYEIVYAKLPYKVVVNEVVEIAKKYGDENSPSFINGILANIIKQTGITNEE